MQRPLYQVLASLVDAKKTCEKTGNSLWFEKHGDKIERLVKDHMPSGSGFDCGTKIDEDASTSEKLVFTTDFHHMDDNGFYCGWSEYRITVRPSLVFDITLKITGGRRDMKDCVGEVFQYALTTTVEE